MKTKILRTVFLLALIFFLQYNSVLAEGKPPGFSISPSFQEINIQKDQASVPFSIEVKNTTGAPVVFRVSVLDFGTLDESGGVAFLGSSDNLKYSLASWVDLPNDTLVLNPGESQSVKGNIENKESLSPGGHYGAVFFKVEDNEKSASGGESSIAFNPSFASLLFVRKVGGEIYDLSLNSEDFAKSILVLPGQMKLRFRNSGNVHVAPRGTIEISDPLGRQVSKGIINADSSLILPETFRVFPVTLIKITPAVIPGRYTLEINYRYDGESDFSSEKIKFFLFPPIFTAALAVLIALAVYGFVFVLKKRKNGEKKKSK